MKNKQLDHMNWRGRERRVRAHLKWVRDNTNYPRGILGASTMVGIGIIAELATVFLAGMHHVMVSKSAWYFAADAASGGLMGWGLVLLSSVLYHRWIVQQLRSLSYASQGDVTSHRWWGVDEMTTRVLYLSSWAGDKEVELFKAAKATRGSRTVEVLLRGLIGKSGKDERGDTLSISEVGELIKVLEGNYDDFAALADALWAPYESLARSAMVETRGEAALLKECMRVVTTYNENERRMLIEMAECAQFYHSSISTAVAEIERCVGLVGQ